MTASLRLLNVVLVVNCAGFFGYLAWLAVRDDRILYAQDGILYVLPCVPFLFVFACISHARRRARDAEAGEETD